MKIYIYKADTWCESCGEKLRRDLTIAGKAPTDPLREHTYDSGDLPKGPFSNDSLDSPAYCAGCEKFLEVPLTEDGYTYVLEAIEEAICEEAIGDIILQWANFYDVKADDILRHMKKRAELP